MFLTLADYAPHIKTAILTAITEGDDTNRTNMEKVVQEEISMALRVRYDVPNVFNKAGDARNQYLVALFVHIVLYRLAARLNPGQITESIKTNFGNAKQDLDKIASGSFELDLPLVGDTNNDGVDDKNVIQWGSMKPRNPYF